MADWRLAIDIGGTFTDVVLVERASGRVVVSKALTTPTDPLAGVRQGCRQAWERAGISPEAVGGGVVHATTLVTNALIEGKGARAALVATAGFGDTLMIRNEHRYDMYDLQIEFPDPPIPRQRTYELNERTAADGTVLIRPNNDEIDALAGRLRDEGVEAVAICFLHSYMNPANEQAVATRLRASLGVPVCTSADVAPQIREYPRMSTTACNAVSMPLVSRYLEDLGSWLDEQGAGRALLIMLSNGGVVAAREAAQAPIRMVESGPAAGALAASWYARRLGEQRLMSFDMGGTTAKACLIEDGEPAQTTDFEVARVYRFKKGSGYPIIVPSVDLVEIGAGGGSIARTDSLGLLKVGPDSAGAEPGPACYGRGGRLPTVTDADLLLGYLDPDHFLGGDMRLDVLAAERALADLAGELHLSVAEAAAGVHEVVNQNMAAAARMHAVERGADLRGVPLVAFGGAGPVHACGVAELLDADVVAFPVNASVLSAFGTLVTPARIDLARSHVVRMDLVTPAVREQLLDEMRTRAREILSGAGVAHADVSYRYGIDARYVGQGNEITIWVGEGDEWPVSLEQTIETFAKEYERIFGMSIPDVPIEVVTWRVSALAGLPAVTVDDLHAVGRAVPSGSRMVRFDRGCDPVATVIYRREELGVDARIEGPALVEERETTIVLRPGWSARVHHDGSIIATRREA